jgi:hypothetical protein
MLLMVNITPEVWSQTPKFDPETNSAMGGTAEDFVRGRGIFSIIAHETAMSELLSAPLDTELITLLCTQRGYAEVGESYESLAELATRSIQRKLTLVSTTDQMRQESPAETYRAAA